MGRFYSAMIERVWVRQKELAAGLGVSTAHTSRMLAVARLPEVLLDAIADKPLSAAQVATLHALMQQVGEKLISERAASLPPGSTTADIFAFLTTGRRPPQNAVSISVARGKKGGKKYLRIDTPDIASVASRVREIELLVNALFATDYDARRRRWDTSGQARRMIWVIVEVGATRATDTVAEWGRNGRHIIKQQKSCRGCLRRTSRLRGLPRLPPCRDCLAWLQDCSTDRA
ncbi:hypothetical protein [Paraburkholderia graminis]|uniref:Uncharacterized protein n=1 Tax=Paraburkholderia graminis TaxID=60548 RepID=A0ABD5CSB1_9BURK|nr:hypothetical protein [Paraburkholderia graminis]MDR6208226.1 hypothetical protein [Paraburkholderia graminis]